MANPTLDFPSFAAACRHLRDDGLHVERIASALGACPSRVRLALRRAPLGRRSYLYEFETPIFRKLAEAGQRRGISSATLAHRIIVAAAEDGIIDAILDDSPEPADG